MTPQEAAVEIRDTNLNYLDDALRSLPETGVSLNAVNLLAALRRDIVRLRRENPVVEEIPVVVTFTPGEEVVERKSASREPVGEGVPVAPAAEVAVGEA